jgi:hypothetical protein
VFSLWLPIAMASSSVGAVLVTKGVQWAKGAMSFDDYVSMKGGGGIVLDVIENVLGNRFSEDWYEMSCDDLVDDALLCSSDENILSDYHYSISWKEDLDKWRHLLSIAKMRARTAREEGYFWVHKRLRGKVSRPYPRVPSSRVLSFQSTLDRLLALETLLGATQLYS